MGNQRIELDELDYAVLKQLQADGRRPFTEIGEELSVSSGTVKNRYLRMREAGLVQVQGFIDPYRVGFRSPVIILVKAAAGQVETTAERIAEFEEVDFVAITSGDFDLDLTVSCRDHDHLLSFVNERLHLVPGVVETRTKMILKLVKVRQANVDMLMRELSPGAGARDN